MGKGSSHIHHGVGCFISFSPFLQHFPQPVFEGSIKGPPLEGQALYCTFFFQRKVLFQLFHRIVRAELPPCMRVHIPQFFP